MPNTHTTRTRPSRIRTTRSLALAALAVPALVLSACGEEVDSAPSLTSAQTSSPPLTAAVLLTDADTVYNEGSDWFRLGTGDEDLDGNGDLAHPCFDGPGGGVGGTGALEVVRADFELRNLDDPTIEVQGDHLTELVARYDDAADAEAAYATLSDVIADCVARPDAITEFRTVGERAIEIDGAEAQILDAHFGPIPETFDDPDAAYIMETGLAVRGDAVVVLTSIIVGQDYNFLASEGGTPVEQMLPVALERLG